MSKHCGTASAADSQVVVVNDLTERILAGSKLEARSDLKRLAGSRGPQHSHLTPFTTAHPC